MSERNSTTLGDIAEIISGSTPKSNVNDYWDGDIAWATPNDLGKLENKEIYSTARLLTQQGLESCSARILPPNSVLFTSRAPIGNIAINKIPMATNQGFKSFIPDTSKVDPNYLYYWLKEKKTYIQHLGRGATFKEVSKQIVAAITINLPPLEEQRRIAKILDKSNYLIDTSKKINDLLDKLALSYFSQRVIDLCPDEKKLGDIVSFKGGGTPKKKIKEYWNGNIPWASVKDFKSNQLSTTKEYISQLGLQNSSANLIPIGTIIIPTRMALGKAAINSVELAINQDLKALIPKQKFIAQYLLSALKIKKESIIKLGQGATVKGITIDVLKNVKIPFPSISEQKKISTSLEKINSLKKISQKAEKRSKEIKDSILMGFFQG